MEINNTPLWSRRRPQLNQRNERTEAVSTLCASFQEVNKNKIHIEEMKLQLLQNENNFKNELYQLQLQAAQKEVEIKTEILKQIKGKFYFYKIIHFQNNQSFGFFEIHILDH